MVARIAVASIVALAGCAASPQVITRVETQRVDVPVQVLIHPPPVLLSCGDNLPRPVFVDAADGLLLTADQVAPFVAYVGGLSQCRQAWRAWAAAEVAQ